jgi:hypothetical protein
MMIPREGTGGNGESEPAEASRLNGCPSWPPKSGEPLASGGANVKNCEEFREIAALAREFTRFEAQREPPPGEVD